MAEAYDAVKKSGPLSGLVSGSAILRALNAVFKPASCFRALSRAFRHSGIYAFLARPEALTGLFYQSALGRAAASVPDACTRALKHLGVFANRSIPGSLTLWLSRWLGERFDVFFMLFVALHALLPFELYRNPYTIAALAFLTVSACARVAFVRGPSATFSLKRVDPVYLLYFAAVALSGAASFFGTGGGAASATTAALYLAAILFAALIANMFGDRARLTALIYVTVGVAFLVALYGIYQYSVGIPINTAQTDQTTGGASLAMGRADATLGNPNILAAWLLLVIPFSVTLFFISKTAARKLLMAAVTLTLCVCLLLTQSRSSWIGLFIAGVVYVFLLDWRLIPLFAAAAALSVPFWPSFILDRLLTAGTDSSSLYRYKIYAGGLRMALAHWATGVGIGIDYFKRYINNYVYFAYETAPVHAHMLPLQIWLESGIVALLSFLWLLLRLIKKGCAFIFAQRRAPEPPYNKPGNAGHDLRLIITACIAAVAGFVTMGCFEYAWFFPRCMNHFFMIIGVFFCAINLSRAGNTH